MVVLLCSDASFFSCFSRRERSFHCSHFFKERLCPKTSRIFLSYWSAFFATGIFAFPERKRASGNEENNSFFDVIDVCSQSTDAFLTSKYRRFSLKKIRKSDIFKCNIEVKVFNGNERENETSAKWASRHLDRLLNVFSYTQIIWTIAPQGAWRCAGWWSIP